MQVFDASSMIYAWDNYPANQFPKLWKWIAGQIRDDVLLMPIVAFEEVKAKAPDCADWLNDKRLHKIEISNAILQDANRIKGLLGIIGDKYKSKGVGENDLLIIAAARAFNATLVSDEAIQTTPPIEASKKKIPAVCVMQGVKVTCINFLDVIKQSGAIF
jgi:predicted nucleic acid-binding protein